MLNCRSTWWTVHFTWGVIFGQGSDQFQAVEMHGIMENLIRLEINGVRIDGQARRVSKVDIVDEMEGAWVLYSQSCGHLQVLTTHGT